MAQQPSNLHDHSTDLDHHLVLFPTRSAPQIPGDVQAQSAGPLAAVPALGVTTHAIREVVLLEVSGRLGDVVQDLDLAIQLALAEGPRGVVCNLSGVPEGDEPGAVEVLAAAGRHVRDWPGIPVAVVSPDPLVRAALAAHPLGGHLIVTGSMPAALSVVLATSSQAIERFQFAPHPTAPRASREFVSRTLLDWGFGPIVLSATLVVSELVADSTMVSATDIHVSVAWNQGALRLTVRDSSPDLPRQRYTQFGADGRGQTAIAGLSRAFGVLPTADGGKVVWAVLNAARPRSLTSPGLPEPATAVQDSPLTDRPSPAGLTFREVSGPFAT